jgi:hypothetical protein
MSVVLAAQERHTTCRNSVDDQPIRRNGELLREPDMAPNSL